ncbi:MAG TPA: hypothetical protein VEY95_11490 [Azospirillaceae bacterium]|nr:hypothetical protein [Azospirillaceae bacterium]
MRLAALFASAAVIALPTAAFAAEGGGGGLPQLNPATFPPQLVWLAIIFATLYWLMARKALPRVGEVLQERQDRITDDLEKAQALRDESNAVMQAYERAVAEARTNAQRVVNEAAAEVAKLTADRQAALQADLATRTRAAEERILAAKNQALANIRNVAAEVASDIARRVAGVEADPAQAETAVANVIGAGATGGRG